jgi:hypothetical protein
MRRSGPGNLEQQMEQGAALHDACRQRRQGGGGDDLAGATRRGRNAFAFFTNQRLTRSERGALKQRALNQNLECEVYDVERIAGALDETAGYGLRAAYLGLPMTDAEQISYFARREHLAETALDRNTADLRRVAGMMARLESQGRVVAETIRTIARATGEAGEPPPLRLVDPLSVGELTGEPGVQRLSWSLGPELILMTHRMVCFELPSRLIGRFRTDASWRPDRGMRFAHDSLVEQRGFELPVPP